MGIARPLSLSRHGAVAAGTIVFIIIGFTVMAAGSFHWRTSSEHELEQRLDLLSVMEGREGERTRKLGPGLKALILAGATGGLAAAELQRIVSNLAATNGVVIASMQVLTEDPQDELTTVRLESEMAGSLTGLSGMLYDFESKMPLLFIREVDIRTAATLVEDPSSQILLRVVVEGFFSREPGHEQ